MFALVLVSYYETPIWPSRGWARATLVFESISPIFFQWMSGRCSPFARWRQSTSSTSTPRLSTPPAPSKPPSSLTICTRSLYPAVPGVGGCCPSLGELGGAIVVELPRQDAPFVTLLSRDSLSGARWSIVYVLPLAVLYANQVIAIFRVVAMGAMFFVCSNGWRSRRVALLAVATNVSTIDLRQAVKDFRVRQIVVIWHRLLSTLAMTNVEMWFSATWLWPWCSVPQCVKETELRNGKCTLHI